MARRYPNFLIYPGTGMWMMATKTSGAPGMYLYQSLPHATIETLAESLNYNLYWIDTGIGAHTLLNVSNGGKSSSATLVTKELVKKYKKEYEIEKQKENTS